MSASLSLRAAGRGGPGKRCKSAPLSWRSVLAVLEVRLATCRRRRRPILATFRHEFEPRTVQRRNEDNLRLLFGARKLSGGRPTSWRNLASARKLQFGFRALRKPPDLALARLRKSQRLASGRHRQTVARWCLLSKIQPAQPGDIWMARHYSKWMADCPNLCASLTCRELNERFARQYSRSMALLELEQTRMMTTSMAIPLC